MVKLKLKSGYEIYLDGLLVPVLDTLVYNIKNDWDFVILITGDRMVRTGKSVMAMNICAYLADKLNKPYDINNIFFDSQSMIDNALEAPTNSIIHYDEAREGLAAIKTMQKVQQDLIDFFNECGQLNHIFVLVLPDYFSLKEEIAVGRSEFLINVYRKNVKLLRDLYKTGERRPVIRFDRGFFELFNRERKRKLFDAAKATRRKSYQLIKANINGRFTNYYPLDQDKYLEAKAAALARFKEKKEREKTEISRSDIIRDKIIMQKKSQGKTGEKIAQELENEYEYTISSYYVNEIARKYGKLGV